MEKKNIVNFPKNWAELNRKLVNVKPKTTNDPKKFFKKDALNVLKFKLGAAANVINYNTLCSFTKKNCHLFIFFIIMVNSSNLIYPQSSSNNIFLKFSFENSGSNFNKVLSTKILFIGLMLGE